MIEASKLRAGMTFVRWHVTFCMKAVKWPVTTAPVRH